jgi:hypothetical protein
MTTYYNHALAPVCLDGNVGYIGDPPSSEIGVRGVNLRNHIMYWRQRGNIFSYCGPNHLVLVDGTYIGGNAASLVIAQDGHGTITIEDQEFYIIDHCPPRSNAADRLYGITLRPWPIYHAEGGRSVRWYPDIDSSSHTHLLSGVSTGAEDVWPENEERCLSVPYQWAVEYTPDSSGGFRCGYLSVENISCASLAVFDIPDMFLSSAVANIVPPACAVGKVIRGHNASTDGSLGSLLFDQCYHANYTTENMLAMSRYPFFQWGHGLGIWTDANVSTDLLNGGSFQIYDPNITGVAGSAHTHAYPACVIEGSGGCTIKYTSTSTADTWTATIPSGGYASPTLVYPGMCGSAADLNVFERDTPTDQIQIDIECPMYGEMTVHTVALFPTYYL